MVFQGPPVPQELLVLLDLLVHQGIVNKDLKVLRDLKDPQGPQDLQDPQDLPVTQVLQDERKDFLS